MPESRPILLRWTRFESNSSGTGPEKRSAQIRSLCEQAGFRIHDMRAGVYSKSQVWSAGLAARIRFGRQASLEGANIGLLGWNASFYRESLRNHTGARVLLWETTYDTMLPAFARDAGYRVLALPHNLEALVSPAVFSDAGYDATADLAAEVRRLSMADVVFTISKEERWWLEAHGISARYLPFFPDPSLVEECMRIRAVRTADAASTRGDAPLLILGSAFNPATARGMKIQLEWLAKAHAGGRPVVVAGAKTETLAAARSLTNTTFLGAVTRERLVELLSDCAALLVHTCGGAGAVTRIPEALLAGIPVIANFNGARDQHGTPGVHVYDSEDEFWALVRNALPMPPPPKEPLDACGRFQQELGR